VRLHVVGDDGAPVAAGETGELVVESPAVTAGYYRNPQATDALFWRPGAVRTGDLAYRDPDGEVFLVGRSKNIIIQGGRNVAPQELEETAEGLPFVRRAAAVGVDEGGAEGEQAYLFAELRRSASPSQQRLRQMTLELVERLHARLGLRPGRVILLRPGSVPLTVNGKIRHGELRATYLEGELQRRDRVVFPDW
jgi:acyl-CoA synthetase (AMP-forming)/AMP-acid ligase II